VITAAAPGYISGQATMTTTGPVPTKLAVYVIPPVLPADGGVYESIVVQLQDDGGSPARAPLGDVWVTLSSSNTTVGSCPSLAVIRAGETFVKTYFYSSLEPGTTVITAMASGYSTGQASVKTDIPTDDAKVLKVYAAPPKLPAEGAIYEALAVQLQDSRGRPARAPVDITVDLSSSSNLGLLRRQVCNHKDGEDLLIGPLLLDIQGWRHGHNGGLLRLRRRTGIPHNGRPCPI